MFFVTSCSPRLRCGSIWSLRVALVPCFGLCGLHGRLQWPGTATQSGLGVTQIRIEYAFTNQRPDVTDALVAWPLEFLQRQSRRSVGFVELLGAHAGVPLRFELWQIATDFLEANPVRAFCRPGIRREFERASGYNLGYDLGQITNAIVVGRLADIIGLIEHAIIRRLQGSNEGPRNVLDMDNWAPWRAIRFQVDLSGCEAPRDKVVQDDVEAHARRNAVSCRGPQKDGAETVPGKARDVALGHDLRRAVSRHGIESASLVNHRFAGLTVIAARRSKDKTRDPDLLGKLCHPHACAMIDLIGKFRPQIAQRIIGESGQMKYRVETDEVTSLHIPCVLSNYWHLEDFPASRICTA